MLSYTSVLGKPQRAKGRQPCSILLLIYILGLLFKFILETDLSKEPKKREVPSKLPSSPLSSHRLPSPNFCHFLQRPQAALKANHCHIKQSKVQSRLFYFQRNSLLLRKTSRTLRSWQQGEEWHKQLASQTKIFSTFWCQTHLSESLSKTFSEVFAQRLIEALYTPINEVN